MHIESLEKMMRLMAHSLAKANLLGSVEVVEKDWLILWVSTLFDNDTGTLTWRKTTDIGKTLFSNDNVQIVLSLINVSAHGNNARDSVRISLGWASGWGMHDGELGVSQEISGSSKTIQHSGSHNTGRVGMGIDINLDGCVHADNTETSDNLGRVGNNLGTKQKLVVVAVPVVVEALETIGREADGGGGGKLELARVKEVEEVVLEHFGPDTEVLEFRVCQATDNGVGNVADTGLKGEKTLWKTASLHFRGKESEKVFCDSL